MFARFKTPGTTEEINVNTTLVQDFVPGKEDGHTRINFLGGDSVDVPFSPQAVRGAFKRALAPAEETTTSAS